MSEFTVIITAIAPGRAHDVARVAPLTMAATAPLPIVAARGVSEAEAEALFHALREAGAEVRLDAARRSSAPPGVARRASSHLPPARHSSRPPPSSRPTRDSSRPPSSRPSSRAVFSRPPPEPLSSTAAPQDSYFVRGLQAYVYPANPGVALAAGMSLALAWGVLFLTSFIPIINIVGGLVYVGIQVMFLSAVLLHASNGHDGPPRPTEGGDLWSFISPAMRVIFTFVIPPILLIALNGFLGAGVYAFDFAYSAAFHPAVTIGLYVWLLYLPASLIIVAHGGHWLSGLNVVHGIRLIARIPKGYAVACVLLGGGVAVAQAITTWLAPVLSPMMFGELLLSVLSFYLAVAGARVLGVLLHHYEDELGFGD